MSEMQTSNATRRRDRIKLLLETMVETKEKVLALITEAKDNDDHLDLGYRSWPEYVSTEYAALLADLNREDRRSAAFALSQTGMSTRVIAPILGVSHMSVQRDLEAGVTPCYTSDDAAVEATPELIDRMADATEDQFEESLASARSQGDLSAENVVRNFEELLAETAQPFTCGDGTSCWHTPICPRRPVVEKTTTSLPKMITTLDGKNFPRPEPKVKPRPEPRVKPRQKPIRDQFRIGLYELDKVVAGLEKLAQDPRFARNRTDIAARAPHLAGIHKRLWDVRKALGRGNEPEVTVIDSATVKLDRPSADLSLVNDVRLYLDALASSPEVAQLSPAGKGHITAALRAAIETLEAP